MRIPLYQVDAFTARPFGGNPAAVCPLESWLPPATMQAIAAENNLSETAFIVPAEGASEADWELRWFTPTVEVDLCGHATLAAGKVVFDCLNGGSEQQVRFATRSGVLGVSRRGTLLELDFPSQPGERIAAPAGLAEALGGHPREYARSVHYDLVCFDSEEEVRALAPTEAALCEQQALGIIATARPEPSSQSGRHVDFVSRFFAPKAGVFEDPVTGSAHCVLTPFWAERLGRDELRARQISKRGGELHCTLRDDRVAIAGEAVLVLEGTLLLD